MPPPRIPRATYRLQLHAGFTFADAENLVPYLADLGISHLYLSPIFKARPGSAHGYDIVDHNAFNPEIGDEAAFDRLVAALDAHDMGILLDIVPNHVGIGSDNAWWMDVLEWGQASPYARFFDINWSPARRDLRGKVLVPVLGDHYGKILESGDIKLRFDPAEGSFNAWYYDHRLPIAIRQYLSLLSEATRAVADSRAAGKLAELVQSLRTLTALSKAADRRRHADQVKARLAQLAAGEASVREAIEGALARFGGKPGDPRSFTALHRLLEAQHYRIAYWRVAADEINYRRFFEINDLAGLRMEMPALFETAHKLVFRLLAEGKVQGLRIDHIDGLYDPARYCQRVQKRAGELLNRPQEERPIYLVVEKILAHHERLRRDWPVAGTTGYEFMNQVNGLFLDGDQGEAMDRVYRSFSGYAADFETDVCDAKMLVMREAMASELGVLATELAAIAGSHWASRDFTRNAIGEALRNVAAHFPIYRTYVTPRRVSDQDRRYIGWAVARARKTARGDTTVYDFLESVLDTSLVRRRGAFYKRRSVFDFAMHFQQYTGPVMAKGYEDTALYRYNRLIALNEVGGDPRRFGLSVGAFHQANRNRRRSHPDCMLATATHDSKRGEDVRARIDVLSEMTEEWRQRLERWARLNRPFKQSTAAGEAPDANDEYLLYQTMLGAWPTGAASAEATAFVERLGQAAVKAAREAKLLTSWTHPDETYEKALVEFAIRITETNRRNPFLDDFLELQRRIALVGMVNGLTQILFKLTVPGVPDIYRGTELWQLDLVDPDNRRPVDWAARRRLLDMAKRASLDELLADPWDGGVKLALIQRVLALRRRHPELFSRGTYEPLAARGPRAAHVCAFARRREDEMMVVAGPVLVGRLWPQPGDRPPLGSAWRNSEVELPRGTGGRMFLNALTGSEVAPVSSGGRGAPRLEASALFAKFPVAVLIGAGTG